MSSKIPKSGLSACMREWMKARIGKKYERRFTIRQICEGLAIPPGEQHQKVVNILSDFKKRGEVESYFSGKRNRRQFVYNRSWRKAKKGTFNQKIYKAMYVSATFAVTDIRRLAGIKDRSWLDKVTRQLRANGHLQQVGRRLCAHGSGAEKIYRVTNRDNFKLELMK
jgi:hypothetical protein